MGCSRHHGGQFARADRDLPLHSVRQSAGIVAISIRRLNRSASSVQIAPSADRRGRHQAEWLDSNSAANGANGAEQPGKIVVSAEAV